MSSLQDRKKSGLVFNIQKYSLHDGPGIRTTVFMKGCPLSCHWCSNPESQTPTVELACNPDRCLTLSKCTRCVQVCPSGAISHGDDGRIKIDRELCQTCLSCSQACPAMALYPYGETRSVEDVLKVVEQDSIFYSRSGGGMTLSGGEPLAQPEFALALLREARHRRIKTSIETCGHAPYQMIQAACGLIDTLLFDIKCMDPERHKAHTGVSNHTILDNFRRICDAFPQLSIIVRTPLIPGFNDNEGDIEAILKFIPDIPNVTYELLPYHRFGNRKYTYLGRECPMSDAVLPDDTLHRLRELAAARQISDSDRVRCSILV